jgi:hypothetical protein
MVEPSIFLDPFLSGALKQQMPEKKDGRDSDEKGEMSSLVP